MLYNYVIRDSLGPAGWDDWASAVESYTLDPLVVPWSSLAGALGSRENARGPDSTFVPLGQIGPGMSFTGLTRDDVGGLRFLLSRLNRQQETLLPDVRGVGSNAVSFVNAAQRPGIDKLRLQRQPYLAGERRFQSVTNTFADIYFTNNVATTQMLQRIVTTPDILFRTADLGGRISRFLQYVNFGAVVANCSDTSA